MFRHPKYYKELRKLRNKLDQSISSSPGDGQVERSTGPGPKLQAATHDLAEATGHKQQAASHKHQAPSSSSNKPQASSPKQQASSSKPQASSSKILEPR